jgi:citrate lyase subunit beta/citryl-CoA lyase
MSKAIKTHADALILDLEDSIPEAAGAKDEALFVLLEWLSANRDFAPQLLTVRVNAVGEGRLDKELDALVGAGIGVIMLPKVSGPDEIIVVDRLLAYAEGRHGRPLGETVIWPIPETVEGIRRAHDIATSSPRIRYMGAGISAAGDMARELGCITTASGMESLYLRSKVLLEMRAAGVVNPMTGVVAQVRDLAAVEEFARNSRQLGYEGMMVIHPSHVDPVNRMFSPSEAEIEEAEGILEALRDAELQGRAAVTFKGKMVDIAMKKTAEVLVQRHRAVASNGTRQ